MLPFARPFVAAVALAMLLTLPLATPLVGRALAQEVADTAPLLVSPQSPHSNGAELFAQHCAGCHIHGGNIIRRAKTLRLAALERQELASEEAIARIAAEGIGQMSGYAEVLGEQGPDLVGAWVWEQAQAGWPRS